MRFPIRLKLLLVLGGMALAATAAYLALALKTFREDKRALVYELTSQAVKTLAAELRADADRAVDRTSILIQAAKAGQTKLPLFALDDEWVAYRVAKMDQGQFSTQASDRKLGVLRDLGLEESDLSATFDPQSLKVESWASRGVRIRSLVVRDRVPLLAVDVLGTGSDVGWITTQVLSGVSLAKRLMPGGALRAFVVDAAGSQVVAGSKSEAGGEDFKDHEVVRLSVDSELVSQVKTFRWKATNWLGAYAKVPGLGLSVIAQVPENDAYLSGFRFLEKTVLFSILVLTIALLVSLLLSSNLTRPLYQLVDATERIARWDFSTSIYAKTNDEIGLLARSFNAMASDLQNQRRQLSSNQQEMEIKVKERTITLETNKKQSSETQDALLRTTRLASLGELAGAAAHEVLNPVNNMNIRVERMRTGFKESDLKDVELLAEIVGAWSQAYKVGGFKGLQEQLAKDTDGRTLLEEDLENLSGIARDTLQRTKDRLGDTEFLGKEISRITRIINNMRALSRVGGERVPMDVHTSVDETAMTLADLFEKRGVALVRDYGAETRDQYTIIADKDELVQVFTNLVRNALQAIGSAKRRAGVVRVSTKRNKNRVEVRIRDNGSGIKKEHLERLFEPNFTTKSLEEGTGLGLSISRRLVRAFGGDIELESTQEGEGTTFLIWFPSGS